MRRVESAVVLVLLVGLLAGCGSGGSSTGGVTGITKKQAEAVRKTAEASRAAEAKAPSGASPTLRRLYAAFPPPPTGSLEPEAAQAVKAGEAACRGKTPTEVKEEFFPEAEEFLEPEQAEMIAHIGDYEKQAKTDGSFIAGQLAADTYAATLEEEFEQAGFQGCIYSLAQGLERRLAPGKR